MEEHKRYNEEFIGLMEKLSEIMLKNGEPFRSRAYQKAQETLMTYPNDITSTNQLKGKPGIGDTIMNKLNEYVETGTLDILEKEKTNPVNILSDIYGIGPKKAKELVEKGIENVSQLRENLDLLNDIQKVGIQYYEDILERIPREEIEEYKKYFNNAILTTNTLDAKMEIVGSYRRGAQSSGDIDVIITSSDPNVFIKFVDYLLEQNIILHVLSRGPNKCLVITKINYNNNNNDNSNKARRVDFLYTTPEEFPFAILYFTGSKIFNTVMRQYALNKCYTFNEHGIYHLQDKKKGEKVNKVFQTEKDIFDFLGLQYKTPIERIDGRAVIEIETVEQIEQVEEQTQKQTGKKKEQKGNQVEEEKQSKEKTPKIKTLKQKQKGNLIIIDNETEYDYCENDIIPIIENFKSNGISILKTLSETQLENIIKIANNKYYNQIPIMTDNQFDIIKEYVEETYPNNVAILKIGSKVERNKAKLPYEMVSMDKIKPDTNALTNWVSKYRGPYVLSCKLDGVSGLYTTEGDTPKLYTKGDEKVGQDVSHLIPFLRLPKTKNIVIRGEFIIPKEVFETKYISTFANPRNMVIGIVNHKHINNAVVDLHFVAYEVIVPQLTPSQQMEYLTSINVETVQFQLTNELSNEILSDLLVDLRKTHMYEIDGIIVSNDKIYGRKSVNPQHAFAFKMVLTDQIAEAKVVDVLWTPSKDGYLKPRVQMEPIHLGGVTIEFATGFNGAFIEDNNIGIGTTIEIIRSGDVIPYIKSVTVPAPFPKMPSVPYKWNDTHIDIMLENILEDPTVKEKNITGFFRGIGVEGLSSGNITRLIKTGYDNVPSIINMTEQDYLKVDGFKDKMANKIYNGIKQKLEETSIVSLMAASNIFGRGFSEKKLELIISELPDILISEISIETKIHDVTELKGMASKTAEAFVNKINDFKQFLIECGLEDKLYTTTNNNTTNNINITNNTTTNNTNITKNATNNLLYGKTVVLTGTRDKNIIEYLKIVGAKQGSSVSKNTYLVVAKNKDENKGKANEARQLKIPILSVEEFIQTYMA